jgi:hypothetical protein
MCGSEQSRMLANVEPVATRLVACLLVKLPPVWRRVVMYLRDTRRKGQGRLGCVAAAKSQRTPPWWLSEVARGY